jgi:hypothetical protein
MGLFQQVGSEFLPSIPSLEVYLGGLDTLVEEYKLLLMDGQGFVTNDGGIDHNRFGALLKRMENLQDHALQAQEVPSPKLQYAVAFMEDEQAEEFFFSRNINIHGRQHRSPSRDVFNFHDYWSNSVAQRVYIVLQPSHLHNILTERRLTLVMLFTSAIANRTTEKGGTRQEGVKGYIFQGGRSVT